MFKLILLWLLLGVLSLVIVFINDMRGQKYDPDYFKIDNDDNDFLIVTIMGPIFLIIVFILIAYEKYQNYINNNPEKTITRLIYNIANIGLEKDAANSNQEEQ